MKNILVVFALVFSCTLFAQDWARFDNETFGFEVEFPSKPQTMERETPSALGNLTMNMFMVDHSASEDSKNIMYMVIHTKYPMNSDDVEESKVQNMLDGSVDGAVDNVQGELVYANKVELNGFPGRETKIEVKGAYMYMNMYVKNAALYAIQTICMIENDDNKDIEKFLSSFKLKKVE